MILFIIVFIVILICISLFNTSSQLYEHATFNVSDEKMVALTDMIHKNDIRLNNISATNLMANMIDAKEIQGNKITVKNNLKFTDNSSPRCKWLETPYMIMEGGGNSLDQLERILARPENNLVCNNNEYMSGIKFEYHDNGNKQRFIIKCCAIGKPG